MRLRFEIDVSFRWDRGLLGEAVPFFHDWVSSFGPNTGWDVRLTSYSAPPVADMLSKFAAHSPLALTLTVTKPFMPWPNTEPLLILFDSTGELAFPCLEQLEISYCKPFARGIFQIMSKRVIGEDTLRDGRTPLRMRIKVPNVVDEVERVELAWLADRVPNLTIQETNMLGPIGL